MNAYTFSFFSDAGCASRTFNAGGLAEGAPLQLPSDPLKRCYSVETCPASGGARGQMLFCADPHCSRDCHLLAFDNFGCVPTSALPRSIVPKGVSSFSVDCTVE